MDAKGEVKKLKVITESAVRSQLKTACPQVFRVPEGTILSPAARDYLQQMKVCIEVENREVPCKRGEEVSLPRGEAPAPCNGGERCQSALGEKTTEKNATVAKYVDYETGAEYLEKPERMTQLFGNSLVRKTHPRIRFRGKLDGLQAEVIVAQCVVVQHGGSEGLLNDLDDILAILREMMRCEVLGEPFKNERIIGLTHAELRDHSHHPMKYYSVEHMKLPDKTMGAEYAQLNLIRTSIRETEILAVDAFDGREKSSGEGIIEGLNRLSSALHIMMCKYLAHAY